MALDLIKENIECEQLLGENTVDSVIRAEYIIPDTHPDVVEVLMLDAKPSIVSKEVTEDKVYLEGQIEYNILYLAKEEERSVVYNVTYTGKFSNNVDFRGAAARMHCEAECNVEHMECSITNERKLSLEGVVKLKAEVYKNYNFEVIKEIRGDNDLQLLKNPSYIDKIKGTANADLIAKSHIQVPMDRPQIGNILKCEVNLHKKEVKVFEEKVQLELFSKVLVVYRSRDSRDIESIEDDVFVSKEVDVDGVNSFMTHYTDFRVDAVECDIKEDDLGEARIIDVEALIKANTKVMYKEQMDMIEDAYSPQMMMNMGRKDYELNVMHGHSTGDTIVKSNIEIGPNHPKPSAVIYNTGNVLITDKKIVEDKVLVEGVLNVSIMYKTGDEDKYVYTVHDELPFNCAVEIPGCKIDMQSFCKAHLENMEAAVEANTIGIKAVVGTYARVNYSTHKEFLVDVNPIEGEVPKKKASITIYIVQVDDTLWKIAKKYATTLDTLVKLNAMENPDGLKPGDKLIIPGRAII